MMRRMDDERGSAMVLALGVLAVLAMLAVIVLAIVVGNKRTQSSDYANNRSFYSADAASEAGIYWLSKQGVAPALVDTLQHVSVSTAYDTLAAAHRYRYDVKYESKQFRPGWPVEYKDYRYTIEAKGASVQQSQAAVSVTAMRLFREGY